MATKGWKLVALGLALATAAPAPGAQGLGFGSDSYHFIKAVEEKNASKVFEMIGSRGASIINNRGDSREAALHLVVRQREASWINFLLEKGGNPNIAASNGDTPLITAARIGYAEGAEVLLRSGAKVDATNRQGETALIIAVQQRSLPLVRKLLENGANPDRADVAAGLSARDYAKRDSRSAEILRLIESSKSSAKPMIGPVLR